MLEFAARAGVVPRVEQFPIADVNRAVDHVRLGKARFRAVLVGEQPMPGGTVGSQHDKMGT